MTGDSPTGIVCYDMRQQQNQAELSRCLVRHFDRIHMLVAARIDPRTLQWVNVDDIVHDIIVETLKRSDAFEYQGEAKFIRWISVVTRRMVATGIRRRREPPAMSIQNADHADPVIRPSRIPGQMQTPSRIASFRESRKQVLIALGLLGEHDRKVIRMVQLEERSLSDVGTALGCSKKAAAKRFSRALVRLRARVDTPDNGLIC